MGFNNILSLLQSRLCTWRTKRAGKIYTNVEMWRNHW